MPRPTSPGRWSAPRSGRRSRSAGCSWPVPSADTVVADTRGEDWEADRAGAAGPFGVPGRACSRRRGLVLRSDLLRPWARWITPVTEQRRYDTRFFAAALPAGQRARDVSGEADDAAWVEPAAALAAARRKEIVLLPPTAVTLAELDSCGRPVRRARRPAADHPADPRGLHGRRGVWLTVPPGRSTRCDTGRSRRGRPCRGDSAAAQSMDGRARRARDACSPPTPR